MILAVVAALIAGWQVIQGYQHNSRIEVLRGQLERVSVEFGFLRKAVEFNRIYSSLITGIAINLN